MSKAHIPNTVTELIADARECVKKGRLVAAHSRLTDALLISNFAVAETKELREKIYKCRSRIDAWYNNKESDTVEKAVSDLLKII